jgi:phosphoglycolate phosphatase-like HAD superfamily hydrolase
MPLPGSDIEIVRPGFPTGEYTAVLFDFDGTLSLIRRNWQAVMIPMMVDELAILPGAESRTELERHVEEFVMRLNGRQTIYQMIQLADEVRARGGTPKEPVAYKHQYNELLWEQVGRRIEALRQGAVIPESLTVPGSRDVLAALRNRGLILYLASGTDLSYVRDETAVLGLLDFFQGRVFGALDNYTQFSKGMIVDRILDEQGISGEQLLGFGDGFVEMQELKRVGATAVGVASEEETRTGVNAWKRNRLVQAGADLIIGDYRCLGPLLAVLGLG